MMKKIISSLLILVCLLTLLPSCYVTRAAELSDIIGTYELVLLTGKTQEPPPAAEGEEPEEVENNLVVLDGIVCYLVVISATDGYFYWKDNENEPSLRHVEIRLEADSEEPEKYSMLHYIFGEEENKLGIRAPSNFFNKTKLNAHLPHFIWADKHISLDYSTTWRFERVNKKGSLDYLYKQVGNITPIEYVPPVEEQIEEPIG